MNFRIQERPRGKFSLQQKRWFGWQSVHIYVNSREAIIGNPFPNPYSSLYEAQNALRVYKELLAEARADCEEDYNRYYPQ